jgi:hypothetical protein
MQGTERERDDHEDDQRGRGFADGDRRYGDRRRRKFAANLPGDDGGGG